MMLARFFPRQPWAMVVAHGVEDRFVDAARARLFHNFRPSMPCFSASAKSLSVAVPAEITSEPTRSGALAASHCSKNSLPRMVTSGSRHNARFNSGSADFERQGSQPFGFTKLDKDATKSHSHVG